MYWMIKNFIFSSSNELKNCEKLYDYILILLILGYYSQQRYNKR